MPEKKERLTSPHRKINPEKDLVILAESRHEISGARLILGKPRKNIETENQNPHIVLWVAPWQKNCDDYLSLRSAEDGWNSFIEQTKKGPPKTSALQRDWQRTAVYRWEQKHIDPGTARLSEKQMHRIVKRVSKDFNLEAPDLHHKPPPAHTPERDATSFYLIDDHKILMSHRNYSYLLHELAHAIDIKINGNKWAHHGPSFVRTIMMLADKYHWCDEKELEEEAAAVGLLVTPKKALPLPQPRS